MGHGIKFINILHESNVPTCYDTFSCTANSNLFQVVISDGRVWQNEGLNFYIGINGWKPSQEL